MRPDDIRRITALLPFLSAIPQHEWSCAQLVKVNPSTPHPVSEGHMLQHAMFILKGSIRIYKINEQGKEITLYRVHGGQSCVLMMASILGELEYEASATIETECEVLLIPVEVFRKWMDLNKPLRQFIYQQFIHRIHAVTTLLENIAFKPMSYRIAQYLVQNSNRESPTLMITHDQLAIELGTAREVISRTLQDFQNKGMVSIKRGKITVMDRIALEQIMGQHLM